MVMDVTNANSVLSYQSTAKLSESLTPSTPQKTEKPVDPTQEPTNMASMKTAQQASLVAHLFGDGQSTNESALKLTFQAAIDKVNEILSAEFKLDEGAVAPISEDALKQQGGMEYWTPENTAKRIVDGSTAFFASFQAANPDLEGEALVDRFIEVMGGGVTQGFEEAKNILGDLKVLEGEISNNIDKTYALVQEGFQNFRNQYLGITDDITAPKTNPESSTVTTG